MACDFPQPYYIPHTTGGILAAINRGEGTFIAISWNQAYAISPLEYSIAYQIFFSTEQEEVFNEGIKFLSIEPTVLKLEVLELTPGDTYFFAVRATQYLPEWYNLNLLPDSGSSKLLPEGLLLNEILIDGYFIEITNIELFPSYGVVQVGSELIQYSNVDLGNNALINLTRGFLGTDVRFHELDGYDGYLNYDNPAVRFWPGHSEFNTVTLQETSAFHYPHFPYAISDGYKTEPDLINTNLTLSDQSQEDFMSYDYSGWHRTDPAALLRGECLDTYYGGEWGCADGYEGVGRVIRGVPFETLNHMREEMLLEALGTGEPVVLMRRKWSNIICACRQSNFDSPDDRCVFCGGRGNVLSWEQFFNPRRADGRIMVRFGPTIDDLKNEEAGLESAFIPDCWTLVFPAIKDYDYIIRFQEDGQTEEFRYEITNVTRNKLLFSFSGHQKFTAHRVRKTDRIYEFRTIKDTSTIPTVINTGVGFLIGPGNISVPHSHSITINENVLQVGQVNQTTSVALAHSHSIVNGIIQPFPGDNHTHSLTL